MSLPGFIPKPEVAVVSGFALYECSDLFGVFLCNASRSFGRWR